MNNRQPWQLKKSKSWGPFWSYQIDSSTNSAQLGTSKMGQMGWIGSIVKNVATHLHLICILMHLSQASISESLVKKKTQLTKCHFFAIFLKRSLRKINIWLILFFWANSGKQMDFAKWFFFAIKGVTFLLQRFATYCGLNKEGLPVLKSTIVLTR